MAAMTIEVELDNACPAATSRSSRKMANDVRDHIKSMVGVTCDVVLKAPGEVPRSQGKAVRVKDMRQTARVNVHPHEAESLMAEEQLILVDERNRATGTAGKTAVHQAGLLHRAFSIFIVDERGRMLLQQRSREEISLRRAVGEFVLRPSASRRAHRHRPRTGGSTRSSASRSDLSFGFFARYRTALDHGMNENEFVYVYFGRLQVTTRTRPRRGRRCRLPVGRGDQRRLERDPDAFTVWFRHYFEHHPAEIARLAKLASRALG